ncbi:hypothetical protein Syun_018363 [Stephania yunnanensis]|uniref:Uncharacterized protein n=1 Tax=Stephania yunnanensis TaxID=152371 RepID=A0AAP0NYB2_9MAGN
MGDVAKDLTVGTIGGGAQLICGHPFDTIKVKLQSQPTPLPGQAPKYTGAIDAVKKTIAAEGLGGLYKGMGAHWLLWQLSMSWSWSWGSLILVGGLAGASFWGFVYPTDVVKSVIQVDDYKNPKFSGSINAFRTILASEGIKGLYKGFGPAMVRSVPAIAACFFAYEVTRSALG